MYRLSSLLNNYLNILYPLNLINIYLYYSVLPMTFTIDHSKKTY